MSCFCRVRVQPFGFPWYERRLGQATNQSGFRLLVQVQLLHWVIRVRLRVRSLRCLVEQDHAGDCRPGGRADVAVLGDIDSQYALFQGR